MNWQLLTWTAVVIITMIRMHIADRRMYLLGVQHATEEAMRALRRSEDGAIGAEEIKAIEQRLSDEAKT